MNSGTAYLEHLTEADLSLLGPVVDSPAEDASAYLRSHPELVEEALGSPAAFELALFLTGVFPDHSAARAVHPIELERLLRSLPDVAGSRPTLADLEQLAGERGAAGLLEWLGPRWYRAAAERTPVAGLGRFLGDLATRFDQARRFLNHLTDQYLFPVRNRWFPAGGG